jgi:hypothetical protein
LIWRSRRGVIRLFKTFILLRRRLDSGNKSMKRRLLYYNRLMSYLIYRSKSLPNESSSNVKCTRRCSALWRPVRVLLGQKKNSTRHKCLSEKKLSKSKNNSTTKCKQGSMNWKDYLLARSRSIRVTRANGRSSTLTCRRSAPHLTRSWPISSSKSKCSRDNMLRRTRI